MATDYRPPQYTVTRCHFTRNYARAWKWITIGPVVLTKQARVAIGDDIAETLQAKAVAVLIGERPGLSSPDSLGVYLTWAPKFGLLDSRAKLHLPNIRQKVLTILKLLTQAQLAYCGSMFRQLIGVALKDESDDAEDFL